MTESPTAEHEVSEEIPGHHPLVLLNQVVEEPITQTIQRLAAAGSPDQEVLEPTLRAALLQAYYKISEAEQFADHLKFNLLFRWFIGLANQKLHWDAALYAEQLRRLNNEQELRQFLNLVIAAARAREEHPTYAHIAATLEHWANDQCPKSVYFAHYTKSPVVGVHFTFCAASKKKGQHVFPSHIFWEHIKESFPKEVEQEDFRGADSPEYATADLNYMVATEYERVSFISKAKYETWEDTVRPYIVDIVKAAKATYAQAKIYRVAMLFENLISLPSVVELSDYFHMLPSPPPRVIPPRLMREQNQSYAFPRGLMGANYQTDLLYDDDKPHWMRVSHLITNTGSHLDVHLGLDGDWAPTEGNELTLDQLPEVADQLKQDIYTAFHSLVTDRTRELFE